MFRWSIGEDGVFSTFDGEHVTLPLLVMSLEIVRESYEWCTISEEDIFQKPTTLLCNVYILI